MRPYDVVTGELGRLDVLILGGNLRQGLTALRSLARSGLRVGAAERAAEGLVPSFTSRWCQVGIGLPDAHRDEPAFLRALLALLEDCRTTVLLPVDDSLLPVLSRHREAIEKRTALALPCESALSLLGSRSQTLALARSMDILVPDGVVVEDLRDVGAAARHVGFPAVVEPGEPRSQPPGDGTGDDVRLACRGACDFEELRSAVEVMLAAGARPVVQPWLPGARESISLFVVDGVVRARFAHVAHRTMPPMGGPSVYRESIWLPPDATAAAEALVKAAGLEGYAEMTFRRDVLDRPVLIEVTTQLSTSVEIAVRAGVNFPLLAVKHATGEPLPDFKGYRPGLRLRWLGGDLHWLQRSITERGRPDMPSFGGALREVAVSSLRPAKYDYVDWLDPRPTLVASGRMGRQALGVRRRSGLWNGARFALRRRP